MAGYVQLLGMLWLAQSSAKNWTALAYAGRFWPACWSLTLALLKSGAALAWFIAFMGPLLALQIGLVVLLALILLIAFSGR